MIFFRACVMFFAVCSVLYHACVLDCALVQDNKKIVSPLLYLLLRNMLKTVTVIYVSLYI